MLHKHCNLKKNEIMDYYTFHQVMELLKESEKYVQFETSNSLGMMGMFGGSGDSEGEDDGYEEANAENINELMKLFGG